MSALEVTRPAPDLLVVRRVFAAPPARLWRLWTDPARFATWIGPADGTCAAADIDLRPGGAWRAEIHRGGGLAYVLQGRYVEVSPPHRLVFTWAFGDPETGAEVTEVTLDLAHHARGCALRLAHARLPAPMADAFEAGWRATLAALRTALSADPA